MNQLSSKVMEVAMTISAALRQAVSKRRRDAFFVAAPEEARRWLTARASYARVSQRHLRAAAVGRAAAPRCAARSSAAARWLPRDAHGGNARREGPVTAAPPPLPPAILRPVIFVLAWPRAAFLCAVPVRRPPPPRGSLVARSAISILPRRL